ncbi:M1 family metallopeptidase [Chitinophaga filiformis]|uniref:Aminopeptidase N n=1 Tax=Chitinophaga filiformis TaxID=104663 RepID=A0A1G8CJG7_CHIFI|nr:M1 family metallopeptidase [Chitinophaga filiformis]SDH45532.1 Peptidase family M1 [Chitinophaga filiformis]
MFKTLIVLPLLLLGSYFNSFGQRQSVDVQHYGISLTVRDNTDKITGTAEITVRFLNSVPELRLDLVGPQIADTGMTVLKVVERPAAGHAVANAGKPGMPNGVKNIPFRQDSAGVYLTVGAGKGETHIYQIEYAGIPRDGLIISSNKFGKRTFFTDNWPDRAHHWLPCIDHPSDKAAVDFDVITPDKYTVVANGLKAQEVLMANHLKRTRYTEKALLPTKIFAIGIAGFAVDHSADIQGIPVYSYVFPENKKQGFKDYGKAGEILRFFTQQIGPYPYKKLANIQSKTIYGGMENAGAIFYSEESVGSKDIEELLAHEIAHQWFGDAVTETDWEHVWLSEGFATYMTHLYMEHAYGVDTLKAGLKADRKKVIAFEKKRYTPVVDTSAKDRYTQLLNANSYQKGGWVLHMLRRQVGDSTFWKGIRNYFATYGGHNANTTDFRKVMEKASGQDLEGFFQQWLYTPGMPELTISPGDGGKFIIRQDQEHLFAFPLEYAVDDDPRIYTVQIKDRVTIINIRANHTIHIDPRINLLFEYGKGM